MNRNTALFLNKFTTFMVLLNTYVASFPSHEKFALTQEIRNKSYSILNYFTETSLRKNKTTALNNLNIAHEQLRSLLMVAHALGYFGYHRGTNMGDEHNTKRYVRISERVDELGRLIGGWIKKMNDSEGRSD